jgi:hypothetical protein
MAPHHSAHPVSRQPPGRTEGQAQSNQPNREIVPHPITPADRALRLVSAGRTHPLHFGRNFPSNAVIAL